MPLRKSHHVSVDLLPSLGVNLVFPVAKVTACGPPQGPRVYDFREARACSFYREYFELILLKIPWWFPSKLG